ncbi:MAG: hypothetical protein HY395_02380 [Candidatus Doudnabacteria bacterium]|nr:hypothetical protein [Candidatus Doudnabacteria bacterium]
MRWFKAKNDKLINLLRQSKQSFRFDQNQIRFNLLNSLASTPKTEVRHPLNYQLAVALASVILFATLGTTFVFADAAKPGDKLYRLDQLEEQLLLKIPFNAETKAKIRAKIVAERAVELSEIKKLPDRDQIKAEAVLRSKQSLDQAIEHINYNHDRLKSQGKTEAADRLEKVLTELEQLAEEQEHRANELKAGMTNLELRKSVEENVEAIKKAKTEVRLKIR